MTTQPMPIEEAVEVAAVDAIVAKVGRESRLTIPLLQAVQAHYGYLPRAALLATPAFCDGRIYFRGKDDLFCIGPGEETK